MLDNRKIFDMEKAYKLSSYYRKYKYNEKAKFIWSLIKLQYAFRPKSVVGSDILLCGSYNLHNVEMVLLDLNYNLDYFKVVTDVSIFNKPIIQHTIIHFTS